MHFTGEVTERRLHAQNRGINKKGRVSLFLSIPPQGSVGPTRSSCPLPSETHKKRLQSPGFQGSHEQGDDNSRHTGIRQYTRSLDWLNTHCNGTERFPADKGDCFSSDPTCPPKPKPTQEIMGGGEEKG